MKSGKEEVMELLEQLPEDTSLEDIQYHFTWQDLEAAADFIARDSETYAAAFV